MTFGLTAGELFIGGTTLLSGMMGSDASSNAANAQLAGSREAAAVQREMFNKTLEVQQPYRAAGYDALNELRSMMSGKYTTYDEQGKPGQSGTRAATQTASTGGRRFMPEIKFQWGDIMHGGSSYTSGDPSADAWVKARNAFDMSRRGVTLAQREQETRDLYNQYYNGTDETNNLVSSGVVGGAGTAGTADGGEELTGSGYLTRQFTPEDFAKGVDPGYAFRFKEGLKAVDRSAAARGGLLGGNQIRGLIDYGQGSASQEYTNAFNRFQTERSNIYNNLAGIAGLGQTSANTVSNAASNLGNVLGENYIGAGNARASGYIGGANAISNAIGQGTNYFMQNQMLNRAFPSTPSYAGASSTNRFIP